MNEPPLLQKADLWEPELPEPNAKGNYPALEALAVLQARDILRARRKLGLYLLDTDSLSHTGGPPFPSHLVQ